MVVLGEDRVFMLFLFSFLIIGALIGWFRIFPDSILNQAGRGMMFGVLVLLLSMGLRIGVDENTLAQMGNYGWQAFIFAMATILGSIVCVFLLEKLLVKELPVSFPDEELEKIPGEEGQEQGKFN